MGLDEAILESVIQGVSLPTLRLYAWRPPCLSLGVAQLASDVNEEGLRKMGWDLVRRPSGGKAILHDEELTYAVLAPSSEPRLAGSIVESYHNLSRALIRGLALLGLAPEAKALESPGRPQGAVCFEVPSEYEIIVRDRKLVGSAQLRRKGAVLQHGSIPLKGDLGRIILGLRRDPLGDEGAADRVRRRAITVSEALERDVAWEAAAKAVAQGFAEALALTWVDESLTSEERARAASLSEGKYRARAWTYRV